MPKNKIHRSPLEKLQRAWEKADPVERSAFTSWLQDRGDFPSLTENSERPQPNNAAPLASGRYLTPDTVRRIEHTLRQRGETFAHFKEQLELPPADMSLARALYRKAPLRLAVIARLESWLLRRP